MTKSTGQIGNTVLNRAQHARLVPIAHIPFHPELRSRFRDIGQLVIAGTTALMFASAIFYPAFRVMKDPSGPLV